MPRQSRIAEAEPQYTRNGHNRYTNSHNEFETEMTLLGIAASKAAKHIFEELGSDCSGSNNDDEDVGDPGIPETIDEVRDRLRRGEELATVSWGSNALNNRKYYIVDEGHRVTVKPKDSKSTENTSVKRVEEFLHLWMAENEWQLRQAEVSERLDKHGEVFDLLEYAPDGFLRTHFAEPHDLDDDPNSTYQDTEDTNLEFYDELGIRRTNDIRFAPTAYYIDGDWYDDLTYLIPPTKIPEFDPEDLSLTTRILVQHRKRNVLKSTARGQTLYWPVREELTWSKRLLANLMRVSSFQAAFGAIRTISGMHQADAVKGYLNQLTGTAGSSAQGEKYDFPAPAVITVPQDINYEFPETGQGNSNHIEVLVQLLRAASSGMRLPEFMLTSNVSEGNFASTLVSEGPFHKGMRFEQNQMKREDMRIIWQALRYAAGSGEFDLTEADIESVIIEIDPPRVQTRNRLEDFEVNQKLWESSLLSGKDHLAHEGYEYESQHAQIRTERGEEFPAAAAIQPTMGPDPAADANPDAEKGVSTGDPSEDPTKE